MAAHHCSERGHLGFVGLLGPHLARMMGLTRSLHLFAAAALGGLIMVVADWLARVLVFPYQAPAGLVATLIGTPYLVLSLARPAHR